MPWGWVLDPKTFTEKDCVLIQLPDRLGQLEGLLLGRLHEVEGEPLGRALADPGHPLEGRDERVQGFAVLHGSLRRAKRSRGLRRW